jgi:hypothetical protein
MSAPLPPATENDEVLFYAVDAEGDAVEDVADATHWNVWERSNTPTEDEPFSCVWEVDAPDRATAERIAYERAAARGIPAENVDSY